ncbi:MAG: DUF1569 domain-containing protein [Gemmataceae bacterium]
MSIDTTAVKNRRTIHYASLRELLADAEKLAAGNTRTLGNWSQGQIYKHLALVMQSCLDGFGGATLPWYARLLGKLIKNRALTKPMPAGFKLTPAMARVIEPDSTSTEDGLAFLRTCIQRLETETQRHDSPFLGKLTVEQWNQLHLRHAELHMSYLLPE